MRVLRKNRTFLLEILVFFVLIAVLTSLTYLGIDELITSSEPAITDTTQDDPESVEQLQLIDAAFKAFSSWEPDRIDPYVAEITKARLTDSALDEVYDTLEGSLGGLLDYSLPELVSREPITVNIPAEATETYEFLALYEKGSADISVELIKLQTDWKVLAIDVSVRPTNRSSV